MSVYKSLIKGGALYKKRIVHFEQNDLVGIIPDTPMFNNIIDMCAKSKCPVDMI